MDATEFDASVGGSEHLPFSANSLKFAASRSVEIAAMTESILQPSKTKLIFQTLPVHMRRRVMSHNSKRLPQRLRLAHLEQLKKSGLPPKQKRPSRKYRRRPTNLLEEYNRRQKRNVWLETHIWHAKRFHMIERWGHRLAYAPCDKSFRACYRASSAHCLMQDISYLTPISISGSMESIKEIFSSITSQKCGLGICAQAYINGCREGLINIYKQNSFPFDYIGTVQFVWTPTNPEKKQKDLWMFVHPSQSKQIESLITDLVSSKEAIEHIEPVGKKRKLSNNTSEKVQIKVWPGHFNRFCLTGPNSHAILVHSLKCIDIDKTKNNKWVCIPNVGDLYLETKSEYWNELKAIKSTSELPPRIVIGLVVKDPRTRRPSTRTKALCNTSDHVNTKFLLKIPQFVATSPLWNTSVCNSIKENRLSNAQYIKDITESQLVPGEVNDSDPKLQSLPVVLVQRQGSQDPKFKKLGYGSGWDIIIPSSYGMPFWLTFIMFGARVGGLRETENLSFEMGQSYFPPDSEAGKLEMERKEAEFKDKYFKLPPSKRVNYLKLGINSPFACPWKVLLKDWSDIPVDDFFVIRERNVLHILQGCITNKTALPEIENSASCLVQIYVKVLGKGSLKRHALIYIPQQNDIGNIESLFEPQHKDYNEELRKTRRKEHIKEIKGQRRKQSKQRKTNNNVTKKSQLKGEPSSYVKMMRELWLPSNVEVVRFGGIREVIGYVSQGSFSFTEARNCGVGYIAYNALNVLLKSNINQVLTRNTTTRKYRLAEIRVVHE
ncbi:hypothetical protein K1T71_006044 [Dendrolimus kikuchii]|uniref:Uncharacterized protein n=1 Tax=Dendrolimus kikuchii TaxID=765133 RepID=A0ACC1D323_9NEOP|nr:hypothetical protein K1T71_006044 [Dendrolimus kikuchii]